jgi:hypothetical protein
MVEAGILAPIFAMMMMLNIYIGGVYETKYRSFMNERFNTMSYASNHCTNAGGAGDGPDNATPATPNQSPPSGDSKYSSQVSNQGATNSMFIAHSKDTQSWTYGPTLKYNIAAPGSKKDVSTEGWAVCNEPPNQHWNVVSEVVNLVKQAAGGL